MTWKSIAVVLALAATTMLAGCGSGGGGNNNGVSGTSVVVAFSLISTSRLPARISGVNIAAHLPAGVSVATDSANPKQISATALVAGSAMDSLPQADKIIIGSYSSDGNLVNISTAGASGTPGFGPGEYARLTCQVAPGVAVTESEITALNTPLVAFKVTGFDAVTHSTVDLTNLLQPHLTVH
jgi:hypothetical protein